LFASTNLVALIYPQIVSPASKECLPVVVNKNTNVFFPFEEALLAKTSLCQVV